MNEQTIQQLPALQLIDNTLFIDNSRLENFTVCPRKAEYAVVRKRVGTFNSAFFMGEVIHLCMKFRYLYYPLDQSLPPECVVKQHQIIDLCYAPMESRLKVDEYRTRAFAKNVISGYNLQWPQESFKLIQHEGKPLVERSFAIQLGQVGAVKIVWIGRIDLGIQLQDGRIFVMDHKTSSVGGDYMAEPYPTSSQMQGYCFSLQRVLGKPVSGVEINALICRKPAKIKGKGNEFSRFRVPYDPEVLDAWQENILNIASDFLYHHARGYFPMHTPQCITKFGPCEYIKVCQLCPSARLNYLYSGDFANDEFSPMHKDRVDLEQILAAPVTQEQLEKVASAVPEADLSVDPTKMISEILDQANAVPPRSALMMIKP
jgi:hypothetical protein